ncbi:MAG TPA: hypothetical protein PKM73_20940 [Verrucomicrobiota bacterium]|nr:hypothetical protein [Verrucomicrobiota bacterium]HNU51056.1 hypothetical protein [Verrucomicrobiota bacterium]
MHIRLDTKVLGIVAALGLGSISALAASATWDFMTDPETGENPLTIMGRYKVDGTPGSGDWVSYDGADGWTDGFLSITGPAAGAWSKIIFPDMDNGAVIAGFTFECQLRIGNGTASPADGFSLNYARAGDPTFTKDGSGNYQNGGWSGTAGEPGSVNGSMAGLSEEGTITGLAIGFDAWYSGSVAWPAELNPAPLDDVIGISVRVDNKIVAQVSLPTLNGVCDDNTSLQTGPQGTTAPDDWSSLCWQPFKVQLTEDKHLSVWWKGRTLIDNLAVDFYPSPGQLVFGGRTGDAYMNTHIDNIVLTTVPADKPLVTGAFADAVSVSATIQDAGSITVKEGTVTMKVNGTPVSPVTTSKSGPTTTATWASPTYLASGAQLTVEVSFEDTTDRVITGTVPATVATYAQIPAKFQVASADTSKPGFLMRPFQTEKRLQPNSLAWTEAQLAGRYGDNIANLTGATDGLYAWEGLVNFNIAAPGDAGNFNSQNGYTDELFPGFPGSTGLTGNSAEEILTYIEFPTAGLYQLGVNSDDGFRVSAGTAPGDLTGVYLGSFDGGRGASDTIFSVLVDPPGIYPIRLIWENGNGELPDNGANCEFFSVKDGVKTPINDAGGLKAYRESSVAAPWVSKINPLRGEQVLPDPVIMAEITDGASPVSSSSVKVKVNGAETTAAVVSAAGKTTVTVPRPAEFLPAGTYTVTIDLTDSATPAKAYTFEWQFTVAAYSVYQAPYGAGDTWNVYLVTRGAKTWVDAEVASKASVEPFSGQAKPGHLVTIHSGAERDFARMIAAGDSVWIGLTDNEEYGGEETGAYGSTVPPGQGKFVWVSGEEYTWAEWNSGEPNDWENGNPGEDGIELYNNGLFNDNLSAIAPEGSGTTRYYVVEYETKAAAKLAGVAPGLLPDGPLPGPGPVCGGFGIRVVRDVGNVGTIASAVNALYNPSAAITDATSPVVNFTDPGGAGGPGIFLGEITIPGDRAGGDDDFVISAQAKINITEAGAYTFGVHSDDGFALRIRGQTWTSVSGNGQIAPGGIADTVTYQYGTGDSNTRAVITLAVGEYDLDFVFFEDGGGAFAELYAAKGEFINDDDAAKWQLVGAHRVAVPGVSAAGWSVACSAPGGTALNSVANAEAELVGVVPVTGVPKIQYADPEAAGGTQPDYLPFPTDTAADDDDFAILGEAQLVIPVSGTYWFGFQGDDGGYLQIVGQTWDGIVATTDGNNGKINGDRIQFDANTGDSRTMGAITLPAGTYTIRTLFWERGGGGYHWVFGSSPYDWMNNPRQAALSADAATSGTWPIQIAPCAEQPVITKFQVNPNGTMTVEWTGGGTLQAAPTILGPWDDIPGSSSPFTFTPDPGQKTLFGRIRQ